MQRLASEIKGISVITRKERLILGNLIDIVIGPDTGQVIGITLKVEANNRVMAVNAAAISGMGTDFVMIESFEAAGLVEEIVRIKEVIDTGIKIIGSKVIDETDITLGKVRDYSVDLNKGLLCRIYIKPKGYLFSFAEDLIVEHKNIIKIEKNLIIVKSGLKKEKTFSAERIAKMSSIKARTTN